MSELFFIVLKKVAVKQQRSMLDAKISLLMRFLTSNNGMLSKRAREQEFSMLSADEFAAA